MLQRFADQLGAARLRALFLLLAATGLASLVLNAVQADWARPVQSLLALGFFVGAAVIIGGALAPETRARWAALLVPAIGMLLLGLFVVPQFFGAAVGAALGWVVAGALLFQGRAPLKYQAAVKHLRHNRYAEAVDAMDALIKAEPDVATHYRFRAEILRLWGKLDRARRDYTRMTELEPDSPVAYNGLAEVNLQAGDYARARLAAERARLLAPDEWVAAYNLGMIEDRLRQSNAVVEHLTAALTLGKVERRHRLLIYLYLARAYARLGNLDAAGDAVERLRAERAGVAEWQTILSSEQATTLRAVIGDDVDTAAALAAGTRDVSALAL